MSAKRRRTLRASYGTSATRRRFIQSHGGFIPRTVPLQARAGRLTYQRLPVERKFRDIFHVDTGVPVSWATARLPLTPCALTQGNAATQRDGNIVVFTGLHITGRVRLQNRTFGGTATGGRTASVLLILVQDTQANNGNVDLADIYNEPGDSNLFCHPLRNLDGGTRFRVLWKQYVHIHQTAPALNSAGAFATTGNDRPIEKHIPLRMPVRYSGNSGLNGDIVDNNIHMFAISTDDHGGHLKLDLQMRSRFVG